MDKETFLAKLAESTREFVAAAIAPIAEQVRSIKSAIDNFPLALETRLEKFASEIEIDYRKVSEIIAPMIPQPVPGVPGKDAVVDYDAIQRTLVPQVQQCVKEVVDAQPKPKDGNDAVVDWPTIMSKMSELINALPKPRDGRDALNEGQLKTAIVHYAGEILTAFNQEMIAINERDFVIRTTLYGRTIEQTLHMPTPIYKGVWQEGEYTCGDQVRRGGAVWHCNAERTTARPDSGNGDWTLAVNKGADGKDFRPEETKALPVVHLK